MKTDDLIAMLASGDTRVDYTAIARRFGLALTFGVVASFVLMLGVYGLRPDLAQAARTPLFWGKFAFPLVLAVGAGLTVNRLGRPGMRVGFRRWLIAMPFVVVWIAGVAVLANAPQDARLALLLGQSWRVCPFNILLLSVPTFAATFWAAKLFAPTRLRVAGAVAGLLSSALATMVYCLHCPEMSAAFWSVWYTAGLALPAAIGACIGPRLLRW